MRAIAIVGQGKDARLEIGQAPEPRAGTGEVVIDVHATAVNRADLMQRRGLYPPPPGAPDTLGLECAGVVASVGAGVADWAPGARVMALLPGGGYAERVAVHAGSLMPIPEGMKFEEAAAIPEVFLTCHLNLFELGRIRRGGAALVHGGGSGIGTSAIALLGRAGVQVIVTCGSEAKCERCRELGADVALNYREGEFADRVLDATGGKGVDVVLDSIGAPYLAQHLRCLRTGGRLVLIGLMGGATVEVPLGVLLVKRLQLIGSTLRARPVEEKASIVASFLYAFGADLESGAVRPVVDRVLPLAEAQRAHELLESSDHFGKVVLAVQ